MGLQLKIMRHKADVQEIEGAQWLSKACLSERFATVLYNDTIARRSKKTRLYCYRGGGSLDANAAAAAAGIVCLCKQWELAAALHCALKLGMYCCPFGPVSNAEPQLCYAVEHVEGAGLLDDDDMVDPLPGSPTSAQPVEEFRELCKDYFVQIARIARIVPHDDRLTGAVSQEWAGRAWQNARCLLDWWAVFAEL